MGLLHINTPSASFPSFLQVLLMRACHQALGLSHPHQGQVSLPSPAIVPQACLSINAHLPRLLPDTLGVEEPGAGAGATVAGL